MDKRGIGLALFLVAGIAGAGSIASAQPVPRDGVVRTTSGVVEGRHGGAVVRYLGLPYAAPPVNALRWRPPQRPARWRGTRAATRSGPACAQGTARPGASEDCLYLDVTVPHRAAPAGRKPVLVWLHGGGFSEGAGSDYDPARMAAQGGAVVVTVDFRLGIFGFFGHRGLAGSGTFGLQDQQAALRWVRDNIGAFGGDPHNVTLFGQSGGSIGTCDQLTSPSSAGLFQRAILQSGSCGMHWPPSSVVLNGKAGSFVKPLAQVEQSGSAAAAALHCRRDDDAAELDCLRLLSTTALDAQSSAFAAAASGTAVLPLAPDAALRLGLFNRVPVLSGHTRDEHRLVAGIYAAAGLHISAEQYPGLIRQAYGDAAPAVLARYPVSRYGGDGALAWSAVFTDAIWACGQIDTENALSRHVPTYTYEFADEHAQPIADLPADFPAGASHASELPNLFEVAGRKPITSDYYTGDQRRLADRMIGYWTGFARTGRPVSASAPAWPGTRPGRAEQPAQRLAPGAGGIAPVDAYAEHQCAFWQAR